MERAPVAAVSASRKGCRAVLVTGRVTGQQATGRREDYKVLLGPVDTTPGAALPAEAQKQHASHMINRTGGEFVAGGKQTGIIALGWVMDAPVTARGSC